MFFFFFNFQKRDARSSGQSRRRRRDSSSDGEGMPEQGFRQWGTEPRQCYAPQCSEQARDNSKYCSEKCGFKLATSRIFQVIIIFLFIINLIIFNFIIRYAWENGEKNH